jgi:hypothetical protein
MDADKFVPQQTRKRYNITSLCIGIAQLNLRSYSLLTSALRVRLNLNPQFDAKLKVFQLTHQI